MGKFQKLTKERVLEAIKGSGGIVLAVQKNLGCESWYTAKNYIEKWQETRDAFKAEAEGILDRAEAVIIKRINEQDTATAKWYLSKKGKERGYSDDLSTMLGNEQPLKIDFSGSVDRDTMEASPDIEISDDKEEGSADK